MADANLDWLSSLVKGGFQNAENSIINPGATPIGKAIMPVLGALVNGLGQGAAAPLTQEADQGMADLKQNAQGTTQRLQAAGVQLNPWQEGAAKALKKLGEQHVMEAAQAGMDPSEIANHDLLQPAPEAQPPVASPANNANGSQLAPEHKNLITGLLGLLGFKESPEAQLMKTQSAALQQKIDAGQPADIGVPQAEIQQRQMETAMLPVNAQFLRDKEDLESTKNAVDLSKQKVDTLSQFSPQSKWGFGKSKELSDASNEYINTLDLLVAKQRAMHDKYFGGGQTATSKTKAQELGEGARGKVASGNSYTVGK